VPEGPYLCARLLAHGLLPCLLYLAGSTAAADSVDFARDIQPLLSRNCYECHGPDAHARKADLRLDTEVGAKASAIVPLDAGASELIRRITSTDPEVQMPPPGPNRTPLRADEVDRIRSWIDQGAPWAEHWAFELASTPTIPENGTPVWGTNPIDAFIYERMRAEGLAPSPEADKVKLLRRVTFDLTGLPPTPAEMDAFLLDTADGAYERAVDRLFASPRYGERMAMHWLDAARFADSNGFQGDFPRAMWPWRDWVIASFNKNTPFDQFVVEQLAGDLLPNATREQRAATGFLRNGRSVTEGGSIEEEWHVESIIERVETVGTVFLGLSLGCARCHDHKYDPFSQRDFYQFYAFLNSTAEKGYYAERPGNLGPVELFPTPEHEKRIAELEESLRGVREKHAAVTAETAIPVENWLATLRQAPQSEEPQGMALRLRLDGGIYSPAGGATALDGETATAPDLGQAHRFPRAKPFTIAVWVRADRPGTLWSKIGGAPDHRGVEAAVLDDGRVTVTINHIAQENGVRVVSEAALKIGVWSHLAVTFSGAEKVGGVGVYVDGQIQNLFPDYNNLEGDIDAPESLRVGTGSSANPLRGAMADFRIYNVELGAAQITALLQNALSSAPLIELGEAERAALAAYYEHRNSLLTRASEQQVTNAEQTRNAYLENDVPSVMVLEELPEPRPAYRLIRGAYDAPDKSEVLQPKVPDFLHPFPADAPPNRLGLAKWIVDPANPLTARVTVNRIWQEFFGAGLVRSPENFGMQGESPSHPALLDWLASEFIAKGWDLKALQKQIVMSATYRQDSAAPDAVLAKDPENRLLARAPRFRFPAELIRDNALAASGLLTPTIGGPSVKPYQPEGLWEELIPGARGIYTSAEGEALYRRSLYTFRRRTVPQPTLATFDAPTFDTCQVNRPRTNTPLQALALLNDTTYVEAARHLALRMLTEAGPGMDERLRYGFRLATSRWPNAREEQVLQGAMGGYLETYEAAPEEARAFIANGKSPVAEGANPIELAAYMGVARVVLSLDETITRE
jgi:hypothetical protein